MNHDDAYDAEEEDEHEDEHDDEHEEDDDDENLTRKSSTKFDWWSMPPPTGITWVHELLSRNELLIQAIRENEEIGRLNQCVEYQKILQTNLLRLVDFCDMANEVVAEGGNLQDHLWPNKRLPEHESYPYPKGYWNPNDFPEDFNPLDLLEDVPCTACKRNKRSGRFCRQELNHEAPNWNYKDPSEGLIPKIEPVDPSKVNDPEVMLAAFQKFQRELRELERQRQEREEQQKLQQAEDEAKEGSEVQPSGAPVPNRGRRHWTEEVGNTFNNSVSLNILLRSIDSAWKPSQASVQRNIKKLPVRQSVYAVVADRPICPFADHVGTRTSEQVRSHLNKYRKRLAREAQRAVDAALATENAVATQSPAGNPSAPFRSAHVAEGDPPSSTPAKGGSLPVVQTVSTAATRLAEPNHSPHIGDDASAAV